MILAYMANSTLKYRRAQNVYMAQLVRYNKLESELHPLPNQIALKLMTSLVATPNEIAEALTLSSKRIRWDLNCDSAVQNGEQQLDLHYTTSASKYSVCALLLNHNNTYLVREQVKINAGQSSTQRLYEIEEVENRPHTVRLTFFAKGVSESEARSAIKNLNSLRNFILCENRSEQVVASLKMLKKPKKESDKYLAMLVNGMPMDEDLEAVEDGDSEDGSIVEDNASMTRGSFVSTKKDQETGELQPAEKEEPSAVKAEPAEPKEEPIVEDLTTPDKILDAIEVADWEARFRRAGYSAEQQRLVRTSREKMEEWRAMRASADWVEQENAKDGLQCWYRTSARGLNTFKCSRVLPARVLDVFRTLLDDAYRQAYDDNNAETKFLKKFCENTFCLYERSKKVLVVAPREFLLI